MEKEYFEHILKVARIKLTEGEKERFMEQFEEIFALLERVKEISFSGQYEDVIENPLREDSTELFEEDVIHVFPRKKGRYLEVPKNL